MRTLSLFVFLVPAVWLQAQQPPITPPSSKANSAQSGRDEKESGKGQRPTEKTAGNGQTLVETIYTRYREGSMLTTEDKEDIRRIVAETVLSKLAVSSNQERKHVDEIEQFERLLKLAVLLHDLIANEGFTDLTFVNPKTGEMRVVEVRSQAKPIVEATARAMEVFGTREKALRWLNTPVRSLGDRTPLSLLDTPEGVGQVQDTLGRVEHGVW